MSQHATKVWIRFQSSKTGKTDHSSLQNTKKQSPSLKLKTSSHEFNVYSLLYAAQTQNQIDWQTCKCSGNKPVSVVLQEPFNKSFSQKLHSPTDKLTNKNLTAKTRSIAQNTQKIVWVSFVCFVSFVSFRLKLRFHMTAFHTLATWPHQNTEMCQSPIARTQAALSTFLQQLRQLSLET